MDHIPSDARKGACKMYEEKKDHLLSQIFHVVSNYTSLEAEIKGLARAIQETFGAEKYEHLSVAQHEKPEAENRFIHWMEEKNAIEKELNQAKEELNYLKLMHSHFSSDYTKFFYEVQHWYEGAVAHRQELQHWYEALVALLNNSGSVMLYSSSDHSVEGLSQGRHACLVEEKEELEIRLSSLIEQNVSIQRHTIETFTALEKERTKLICECNEHKECIDKLKLEYEQVNHEKCALQGDLDFLEKNLATRVENEERMVKERTKLICDCNEHKECIDKLKLKYEQVVQENCALQGDLDLLEKDLATLVENEERISSEVAELKRRNEDLVQELETVSWKDLGDEIVRSMCIFFIAWCLGLGLGKAFILFIMILILCMVKLY